MRKNAEKIVVNFHRTGTLICSQTLINLKHIQKLEILYEYDVRFHTKVRSPICHVLLAVQNTHRRALLFIDNRQFIGSLHKHIQAASTDINVLSRIGPKRCYIQT